MVDYRLAAIRNLILVLEGRKLCYLRAGLFNHYGQAYINQQEVKKELKKYERKLAKDARESHCDSDAVKTRYPD